MRRDGDHRNLRDLAASARAGQLTDAEFDVALQRVMITQDDNGALPVQLAEAAVEVLDNAPVLYAAIREVLLDPDDIEDAMQETLLAVSRSIHTFQGRSSLKTWAVTIARRKAIDLLRRKHHGPPADGSSVDHLDEASRFSSQWATHLDVANAVAGLSPKLREVFDMAEVRGLSYDEIAASLSIPRNTVASRLRRARAQLQLTVGALR